jgi:hypothetical protein
MKRYEVITISRVYYKKVVEANSEEEAAQKVKDDVQWRGDDYGEEEIDANSTDTYDVREIEE